MWGRSVTEANPARRVRRWILFALAMASLVIMTFAGVLLAFSVPVTDEMLAANSDLPEASRVIVVPIANGATVRTHLADGEGALLVGGKLSGSGSFPASASDLSMRRALVHVSPVNGTYEPATLTLAGVPSRNGTRDLTLDVAALAGGASGWIVMGSAEDEPTFYAEEDVVGDVARFASINALGATFALGFLGFVAPLIGLVVTHKAPARRSPAGADILCRECGGAMPHNGEFCLRCGAWRGGMER